MKKLVSLFLICTLLISTIGILPVQAEYKRLPFTDIRFDNASGYLNVENLYNKGIINGKSDTKFAPNDPLTREEVAKIIVLAMDKKLVDTKGTFGDVKPGSWYEPYVETAVAEGIVKGIGDGKFGVGERITRQDAIVLIGRMADALGIKLQEIMPAKIEDTNDIADYARDYAVTLIKMNAVDMDKYNRFMPKDHITRLDFCKFLDRVLISDVRAYDDALQQWIPSVKEVADLDSLTLAYEDFENGIKGWVGTWPGIKDKPAHDKIVSTMGKESKSSLKITTSDDCNLFFKGIKPTTTYFVAYDIKTEGLDGDSFARVNYVFETPNGEQNGNYSRNNDIGGDNDWVRQTHQVTAPTPDASPEALRLYFSVRGTTNGCAYIDNLEIYEVVYEPVISYLKKPSYKGLITDPNGEGDIILTSYVNGMGSIYDPEKTKLVNTISDMKGNVIMKEEVVAPTKEMDINFSSKSLAIGDYDLCTKLVDIPSGKEYGSNHYMLRKRASDFKSKYNFDEYGRLTRDGKPWFVFGSYAIGIDPNDLEDFKGTNIDVLLCNSKSRFFQNHDLIEEFDKAGIGLMFRIDDLLSYGMRAASLENVDVTTIASERAVLERTFKALDLKDRPSFMGWQLNNESPALQWGERMGWTNQLLQDMDFDHLVYGVSAGGPKTMIENSRMQDIYSCDDPYPIAGKDTDPLWKVWDNLKPLVEEAYLRPVWSTLQVSDLYLMGTSAHAHRERGPSEQELRNMAWQAVCAGAQGINYYAHFHVTRTDARKPKEQGFAEYLKVTDEIHNFEDVILSVEDTPDIYQKSSREDRFAWGVRRYQGKTYVFLVNSDKQPQSATFKVEGATAALGVYGNKQYPISDDGYIDVKLDSLGVEVLVIDQPEPKSADCSLKNAHFSSDDKNYFVSIVEDGANILHAEGAQEVNYSLVVHKDAVVKLNGETVSAKGSISLAGVDKLTFTVTSEDGKHKKDYVYNVVK